ncbi:MAG TPA: hypothetical protein VJ716_06655 [Gaiellaceae bacterium]|nr:hypothetical protein [Gaiellaceae bacterium]
MSWKILVAALVGAIVCVPTAAAASAKKHPPKLRLALVPLQTAQLGPDGASLPLEFDSGTVPDRDAGPSLKKLGRVSGYLLDYGNPESGGPGVTSIETQVERFRTPAKAKKGLKYWKRTDTLVPLVYRAIGVTVGARFVKVRAVGSGRFAYVTSMQIPNADVIYTVDEVASIGGFVLHATVAAGTESTAQHLAPVLMARLANRLREGLHGHLHGRPAKLPALPAAGPPVGGPDLAQLVLGTSDFTPAATIFDQAYAPDPTAISTYELDLRPAAPFTGVEQTIGWYANANEVTWEGTLFADIFSSAGPAVDLSAIGDNARGAIAAGVDQSGAAVSLVVVTMWRGQALDFAVAEGPTTIQPSDVQTLAQAMATHLDAGLPATAGYAPTTWTSQRLSRSRSSSMKRTRCQVPSWSSPSRTGTDSPAVPSSMAMQWEWPLPWSMSSGQMFSVLRSQSSCA